MSVEQFKTYESYFHKADIERTGYVGGATARDLFLKSGLPKEVLAKIWSLSDTMNQGRLDKISFSVAMHLINMYRRGHPVPETLPQSLVDALNSLSLREVVNPGHAEKVEIQRSDFSDDFLKVEEARKWEEAQRQEEELRKKQEEAREQEEISRRQEEARQEEIRRQEENIRKQEEARKEELKRLEELKRQEEVKRLEELKRQEEAKRLEEFKRLEATRRQKLMTLKTEVLHLIEEKKLLTQEAYKLKLEKIKIGEDIFKLDDSINMCKQDVSSLELQIEKLKIKGASIREKIMQCVQQIGHLKDQKLRMETMMEERSMIINSEEQSVAVLESQILRNKNASKLQKEAIEQLCGELENVKLNQSLMVKKLESRRSLRLNNRNSIMISNTNHSKEDSSFPPQLQKQHSIIEKQSIPTNPFSKPSSPKISRKLGNSNTIFSYSNDAVLDDFGTQPGRVNPNIVKRVDLYSDEIDNFGKRKTDWMGMSV